MTNSFASLFGLSLLVSLSVHAVASSQLTVYWGQNSNGQEKDLSSYCQDDTFDIIVLGFVIGFPGSGTSSIWMNMANHCETPYPGFPQLLSCPDVGRNITFCQQRGKKILMSFGGAVGSYGFSSDSQAQTFAGTVWDMFLGGSGSIRPFGSDVILDGVDLDIEGGGSSGYAAFTNALRGKFQGASKKYYISAAPQCPYPDAFLGPFANSAFQNGWFDYVWVQFYNNYCGLNAYPAQFNFDSWATWAKTSSLNKNVQIFIGAPASTRGAGSGYVTSDKLSVIANAVSVEFGSVFGGIMLWDAGNSDANGNFGNSVKTFLKQITSVSGVVTPVVVTTAKATTAKTPKSVTTGQKSLTSGVLTTGVRPVTSAVRIRTSASVSSASVTSGASVRTTGVAKPSTTGKSKPSTTGKSTLITSGKSTPITTSRVIRSATTSSITSAAIPASTSCTIGHMECVTSETYHTCSPTMSGAGDWSVEQQCPRGTTCLESGNWIYCV